MISFDLDALRVVPLLFQTGYLTVVDVNPSFGIYTLSYPNLEVSQSLQEKLLLSYGKADAKTPRTRTSTLLDALNRRNIAAVINLINATLAEVPYDLWRRDDEHIYHALVHLTFSLLGVYVKSEIHTAHGRCDALVETDHYVYVFEFKVDSTAAAALAQIAERGYLVPFADDPRERVAVGISFDTQTRQVGEWEVAHLG